MGLDIEHLRSWIGREQAESEILTSTIVDKFNATFDRVSGVTIGDEAPLLIHLCLAQPVSRMSELGRDGHPELGGFLPPVPLPRRMWAGGAFDFLDTIRIGELVSRQSKIVDVQVKAGRSGLLCFVTVEHEVKSDGRLALKERQDIVYRDIPASQTDGPASPENTAERGPEATRSRRVTPDPTLLFRYSALTFNGHRIHYDRSFCTETEGYPGLVVHGPLQATMLCQYAADLKQALPISFRFRSNSPIFDNSDFTLNAEEVNKSTLKLWTAATGGQIAMEAQALW